MLADSNSPLESSSLSFQLCQLPRHVYDNSVWDSEDSEEDERRSPSHTLALPTPEAGGERISLTPIYH